MRSDYYVYAWRRPDTGAIFYVGKGKAYRDTREKRSNPIFVSILNKLRRSGFEPAVERIRTGLTEPEALLLERHEIAKHGRINLKTGTLANLTDGGEGTSGAVQSAASRTKISAANSGRKLGPLPDSVRAKMSAVSLGRGKEPSHTASIGLAQRKSPPRSDNKTGFKGVSFHKSIGKYCANISLNGVQTALGLFPTPELAALAYDRAAFEAWGGNCYLNFPVAMTVSQENTING